MLYNPLEFDKGLSGKGNSRELNPPDKLCLLHTLCKAYFPDIFTYTAGLILLYFLTFRYNLQRTEISSFFIDYM